MSNEELVERYFAAMRLGVQAEQELISLFHEDAVYIEPFIEDHPAVGIDDIHRRFRKGWENPLPDLELEVLTLEVDGSRARSTWECRSPALPGPVRGEDLYVMSDGKISRLEVRITDEP